MKSPLQVRGGILFLLGSIGAAFACVPYFPITYLGDGFEWRILTMPDASFRREAGRILEVDLSMEKQYVPQRQFVAYGQATVSHWETTLEADEEDLYQALAARAQGGIPEPQYRAFRMSLKRRPRVGIGKNARTLSPADGQPGRETDVTGESSKAPNMIEFFSDALVFQVLPEEFALYCQGARAYHQGDMESAIREWRTLLDLPAEERQYRSTWAAYMIAKALQKSDPAAAIPYYAKVREFADAGFHDTLLLANDSFGFQAQAEMQAGMHAAAIQHYAYLLKNSDESDRELWGESLQSACWAASHAEHIDANAAKDPLCRRLVAAYLISEPSPTVVTERWSEALREAGVKKPYPEADRLAWAAYNAGDIENAQRWVDAAAPDSPYAKWVQSKLLLRAGSIDQAIKLLHTIVDAFPQADQWPQGSPRELPSTPCNHEAHFLDDCDIQGPTSPSSDVKADLGVLLLGRSEYVKALDLFAKSHYSQDAAYIAERVLTISELRQYVDVHANDPTLHETVARHYEDGFTRITYLKAILARRMIRAGQWDAARKYLSEADEAQLGALVTMLRAAAEKGPVRWGNFLYELPLTNWAKSRAKEPDPERAKNLIAAAQYIQDGNLMRTELEPDWEYAGEGFELTGPTFFRAFDSVKTPALSWMKEKPKRPLSLREASKEVFKSLPQALLKVLEASNDEVRRVWKSAPKYNYRYHYRYIAADLYWQAAQSLPDNDMYTLQTLYEGGALIKGRNPKAADRFYKAMVRRCPELPYAQEAERLHWFPKTPPE
ncbi:MAG: hypothetical protein WC655_14240 [Candidatus Hydrogenedentales bacterium]|jgi:hypothetical protein